MNRPVKKPYVDDWSVYDTSKPSPPILTWEDIKEGLKTGLAAAGTSFTGNIYSGGRFKENRFFDDAKPLSDFGRDVLLLAAEEWLAPTKIGRMVGKPGFSKSLKYPKSRKFRFDVHRLPNQPSLGKHAGKVRPHWHYKVPDPANPGKSLPRQGGGRHRPYE
jgi:hypothetical protein